MKRGFSGIISHLYAGLVKRISKSGHKRSGNKKEVQGEGIEGANEISLRFLNQLFIPIIQKKKFGKCFYDRKRRAIGRPYSKKTTANSGFTIYQIFVFNFLIKINVVLIRLIKSVYHFLRYTMNRFGKGGFIIACQIFNARFKWAGIFSHVFQRRNSVAINEISPLSNYFDRNIGYVGNSISYFTWLPRFQRHQNNIGYFYKRLMSFFKLLFGFNKRTFHRFQISITCRITPFYCNPRNVIRTSRNYDGYNSTQTNNPIYYYSSTLPLFLGWKLFFSGLILLVILGIATTFFLMGILGIVNDIIFPLEIGRRLNFFRLLRIAFFLFVCYCLGFLFCKIF